MNIKKITLLLGLSLMTTQTYAANWLMLQGTEKTGSSARAKVWGFIQPEYQSTDGTKVPAGPWAGSNMNPNMIKPDNKSTESFNIRRARIGVRGTGFPLDDKVNYFFLAEFGNNGITKLGGTGVAATDASITLNHIPGARIRVGLFKTPTAEEGLQAIHVFNYVNFTNISNQMMLERFTNGDGSTSTIAPGNVQQGGINAPTQSVGAFRDQGIQVFDTFKFNNWEHSYAVMYGNGNGINFGDNDDNKDLYLRWSSTLVFGGKGARRQDLKMFVWQQDGKRTLTGKGNTGGAGEYDRTRNGLGFTFLKGNLRAAAEYMTADGMIFNGSDGGATVGSNSAPWPPTSATPTVVTSSLNVLTDNKANGYYLDFGYKVIPKLELDLRYDVLNRGTEGAAGIERKFETVTLGAQFFFNKKTRVTFNYEFRDLEAPGQPSSAAANLIGDGIDDRLSLQLLAIF